MVFENKAPSGEGVTENTVVIDSNIKRENEEYKSLNLVSLKEGVGVIIALPSPRSTMYQHQASYTTLLIWTHVGQHCQWQEESGVTRCW